jgi:ammonia channel protein AmtB
MSLQMVDTKYNPNLTIESTAAVVILNTFLSASSGSLMACLLARIITHQWSIYRMFGGAIAGVFSLLEIGKFLKIKD